MKLIKLSIATALVASSLLASEAPKSSISVSGDVTFTSNSIWRGGSGTNNSATVQGTLGVEHESGVYAGMWGTGMSVDTSDGKAKATGTEIDLFIGYATEISGISIDVGFVDMSTTQVKSSTDKDATEDFEHTFDGSGEVYLGAGYSVAGIDLGATLYAEVLDSDSDSVIIEGTIDKDFGFAHFGVAGGYHTEDAPGQNYYSATVGKSFESINGDLSFTYADTTASSTDAVYAISYTTSF